MSRVGLCPECKQGKHRNCDGYAGMDDQGTYLECECPDDLHTERLHGDTPAPVPVVAESSEPQARPASPEAYTTEEKSEQAQRVKRIMESKPVEFNLTAMLQEAQRFPRQQDRLFARAWAFEEELRWAGREYARAKTVMEKRVARRVVIEREAGEKSATVAEYRAMNDDDAVFLARLAYRVAEQRIDAAKNAIRICQAQLDDLRTQAANQRALDTFHGNDRTAT